MNRCGFTLLEVMIAVAVTGVISLSIWAAASQIAKVRDIVGNSQEAYHEVRIALELINRDLQGTFLSNNRGAQATHDPVFIGTDGGHRDALDFASFSHTRRFFDADESDQQEVSYYVAPDDELSGVYNLVRRTAAVLDTDPLKGGQHQILVHHVESFDLEYYDIVGKQWQDHWDTTQAAGESTILPTQVRIRLEVNERVGGGHINARDNNYKKVVYGTVVPIPMRSALLFYGFTPGMPLGVP